MKLNLSTPFARKQKKASKKRIGEGIKRKKRFSSSPLTFLIFFALASGFWLLNRMQTNISRDLYIPVSFEKLPAAYTISSPHVQDTIALRVQDTGFQHIRYDMNPFPAIVLPLRYDRSNKAYLGLSKDELKQEIMARLSPTAQIQLQDVESYFLPLKARSHKRVPIVLNGELSPAKGYTILKHQLSPDSVLVYGDATVLRGLKELKTQAYSLLDVRKSLQQKLKLQLSEDLDTQIKQVVLSLEVEELTEQVFSCPIRHLNVPKGSSLITLPSEVTVRLTLPLSYHSQLKQSDIVPFVDYQDVLRSKDEELTDLEVQLMDYPSFIQSVSIEPRLLQFVVERD